MRSQFVTVPMSVLQPAYSATASRRRLLKILSNLRRRQVTFPVLPCPPPDPPDPPDPTDLHCSFYGSPLLSLISISSPPSSSSAQIPSFLQSSSIISIPTGSCHTVHCCCSDEISCSVMQPLARALTFSAECSFFDTSISSLPQPLLHCGAYLVTLIRPFMLDFGSCCGLLTVDCSSASRVVPILPSATILASFVLKDLPQVYMIWEYLLANLVNRVEVHIGWDKKYILILIVSHVVVLLNDLLMDLFSSTFISSSGIYVALVRSLTAVCSSVTIFIMVVGVALLDFSPWWQMDENPFVIFSPMNMIVAGSGSSFVSCLEQSPFPIFPLIWSELDEQASLVMQGSFSHRVLFSASGAVCVVLWATLDAIFQEVYETVVMRFYMVFFVICIAILSFMLLASRFAWLVVICLYSPLMEFKLF